MPRRKTRTFRSALGAKDSHLLLPSAARRFFPRGCSGLTAPCPGAQLQPGSSERAGEGLDMDKAGGAPTPLGTGRDRWLHIPPFLPRVLPCSHGTAPRERQLVTWCLLLSLLQQLLGPPARNGWKIPHCVALLKKTKTLERQETVKPLPGLQEVRAENKALSHRSGNQGGQSGGGSFALRRGMRREELQGIRGGSQGWKTTRDRAHFQGQLGTWHNPPQHSGSAGINTLIALNNEDPCSVRRNT